MHRYEGGKLAPRARIALLANDALGNFAVPSPVGQMLKSPHAPCEVHCYTGTRVMELATLCPWYDRVIAAYGMNPRELAAQVVSEEPYDLVVNVENSARAKSLAALLAGQNGFVVGPCANRDGRGDLPYSKTPQDRLWADPHWISPDINIRYPFLKTSHISEIFARGCHLDGAIPPYNLPSEPADISLPDVLIATTASLPEKLWPIDNWIQLVQHLKSQGLEVGLLGAKPKEQAHFWHGANEETRIVTEGEATDLRGELTLPQVVWALGNTSTVITLDNGILHFACSTGTPTLGLFRNGIHRLWAPPVPNLKVIEPGPGRSVNEISLEIVIKALNDFQVRLAYF